MTRNNRSTELFNQAQSVIPGGVNSPVRAFKGVGGSPIFFSSAKGAYLYDVENNPFIDYIGSWGAMILGHNHPKVIQAIQEQTKKGISFGAPTEIETELAMQVRSIFPSMELIRMVNSGTEATMSAIRLARGFTNKELIIKFEGCYHGHSDALLVEAGSGALTLGVPNSLGVTSATAQQTIILPYNDITAIKNTFDQFGDNIACIIVEPVVGNMNCILPIENFLTTLRHLCDQHGSVLIFDEVMTGFRVALGGAQAYYNIKPDLTTLGKVIGAGLPIGAFGGRKEIMEYIAPLGPVYQAGTLSGNPLAMAAGLANISHIQQSGFYESLTQYSQKLCQGLQEKANQYHISFTTNHLGGMFGLFFTDQPKITNFKQVMKCNSKYYAQFFHKMLEYGIYLAPSAFEAGFVSNAHNKNELDKTLIAAEKTFQWMQNKKFDTPMR